MNLAFGDRSFSITYIYICGSIHKTEKVVGTVGEKVEDPLLIRKAIHRLPGGSQPHMVQCEDGRFYVAKFAGNPQGYRTLVNEWVVSHLMVSLGICTPEVRILYLPSSIRESSDLHFLVGDKRVPILGDLHLGSPYPVDPETTAIFDFLPDRLLPTIVNLADFAAAWVIDRWTNNTDTRQAVFVRAKGVRPFGFRAFMIDHGMCFDGAYWELRDASLSRFDWHRNVYRHFDMPAECERTLDQIEAIGPDTINEAAHGFPSSWLNPRDRECLDALVISLMVRKSKLRSIIDRHLDAQRTADNGRTISNRCSAFTAASSIGSTGHDLLISRHTSEWR